jgi:hypothetical protein
MRLATAAKLTMTSMFSSVLKYCSPTRRLLNESIMEPFQILLVGFPTFILLLQVYCKVLRRNFGKFTPIGEIL